MFLEFGDGDKAYSIFQRWVKKEIDSAQEWTELLDLVKDLTAEQFDSFLKTIDRMQVIECAAEIRASKLIFPI